MILNLAGVKKSIADKVVPVGTERIIDDVVREAFERFIEGTKPYKAGEVVPVDDVREGDGIKKCLKKLDQKQQQWLKDNL